MDKWINRFLLLAGAVLLSVFLVRMTDEVVIREISFSENEYYEDDSGQLIKRGLCTAVNGYIHGYNTLDYKEDTLCYLYLDADGWIRLTDSSSLPAKVASQSQMRSFYGFLSAALSVCIAVGILVFHSLLPGMLFTVVWVALNLLVGLTVSYENLIGAVLCLLLLNWGVHCSGKIRERLYCGAAYGLLVLLLVCLPAAVPEETLPTPDEEMAEQIFSGLERLSLVTERSEGNENQNRQTGTEETDTGETNTGETDPEEPTRETMDPSSPEEDDDPQGENDNNPTFPAVGNGNRTDLFAGFGSAGGGVSNGRTDRTGNLKLTGQVVYTAELSMKPESTVYIRMFYAEAYDHNRWSPLEADSLAEDRIFYGGKGALAYYSAGDLLEDSEGYEEEYEMEGMLSRVPAVSSGQGASLYQYETLKLQKAGVGQTIQEIEPSRMQTFQDINEITPDTDIPYLKDICLEIPDDLRQDFQDHYPETGEIRDRDEGINPVELKEKADTAGRILKQAAYYTLSPGAVPQGKDFIQWFLHDAKKGYCMHFASAGVMLLRSMNAAARYAEGYSIPVSAWEQQSDGSWKADIRDSNAHAWAEVYQPETRCFVPVEMTPAYTGDALDLVDGQESGSGRNPAAAGLRWFGKKMMALLLLVIGIRLAVLLIRYGRNRWEIWLTRSSNYRKNVQNMMKLTRKRLRKKKGHRIWKKQEEMLPEENEQIRKWYERLDKLTEQAAYDRIFTREQDLEAYHLYVLLKAKNRKAGSLKKGIPQSRWF